MPFEPTKEFLAQLQEAATLRDEPFILGSFSGMHPSDISDMLYEMDTEACKFIFSILDSQICSDILTDLDSDTRAAFLREFSSEEIALFIDGMDSDDGADLLNEQPIKLREEVIALMRNHETANNIVDLLHYDENCAGGLMAKELVKANISWTVRQCIEEIRRQAETVEKILTVYVVDNENTLLGRISLKKIILSSDNIRISDIYDDNIESVQTYEDGEDVADLMQRYDLETIPVVNVQGKLMGRITIDDVLDLVTEQAEKDQQIMAGISENIEEDDTVWTLSRARLPWLLIGTVGGLLGAQFIGLFEGDLAVVPAMAFFIPLITATGGNVGIQSSTLVVQTLASSYAYSSTLGEKLWKALLVAIINGFVIGGVVFCFNMFFTNLVLAFVVSSALFCVVMLASIMGTVTPLALHRMGINPALAAGPFITTANDLLGLAVYFMVARLLL